MKTAATTATPTDITPFPVVLLTTPEVLSDSSATGPSGSAAAAAEDDVEFNEG
ncbi:hypothetical protein TIFTF001_000660, partial [Ficus carica]